MPTTSATSSRPSSASADHNASRLERPVRRASKANSNGATLSASGWNSNRFT